MLNIRRGYREKTLLVTVHTRLNVSPFWFSMPFTYWHHQGEDGVCKTLPDIRITKEVR